MGYFKAMSAITMVVLTNPVVSVVEVNHTCVSYILRSRTALTWETLFKFSGIPRFNYKLTQY